MKVLFLTPWYPDARNPNHGVFVRDQVLTLQQKYTVRVVSSKIDYTAFGISSLQRSDSEFQGVQETRIVIRQSLPVINQLHYFVRTIWQTWKIARQFKPDIIHGNIGYPGAFWSWAMHKLLKIPFIVTEHTRLTNNFRSSIHRHLTLFALKRASVIIAVSRWHADEIFSITGKRPVVIPNIVNFKKFPEVTVKPDTSSFQIGFLGGMDTPVKGLDVLLKAVSTIAQNFTLHIGGGGGLLARYKIQAQELGIYHKCMFYGFVPHEEVPAFMKKLHFFVSASRFETFGIAMVEAIACGLPVIATASGGPKDFITPENGLLVPPENSEALREAILTVIKNYTQYEGDTIRRSVVNRFSAERFLHDISAVYNTLL